MKLSSFAEALGRYGTYAKDLSTDTLERDTDLLEILTGDTTADDDLLEWTVKQIRAFIDSRSDDLDHRTAQTIFAASREFRGLDITQRKAYLRSHGERHVVSNYRNRRVRLLELCAAHLRDAYRVKTAPLVMFAGRYLLGRDQTQWSQALAAPLAARSTRLICGGSIVAADLITAMGTHLHSRGIASEDRLSMLVRSESTRLAGRRLNYGTITHVADNRSQVRHRMIRSADVCIAFGGGAFPDSMSDGLAEEMDIADKCLVPVIPIAAPGGTALRRWQTHRPTGLPASIMRHYDRLRDADHAIDAAMHMIDYYLGSSVTA